MRNVILGVGILTMSLSAGPAWSQDPDRSGRAPIKPSTAG